MLIELHAHTSRHSRCSGLEPTELIRRAVSKKLQGVVIVEHHYLWSDDEISALRREAGVENYFVILKAQEVDAHGTGHIIVIGADETIPQGTTLDEIKKIYPASAIILAHPFRGRGQPDDTKLTDTRIDAVEIFNSNQTMDENFTALEAWHRLKFRAVAGSDAHSPEAVGIYPTIFDHPIRSVEDLVSEIKNSRARPFYKEIPKAGGNTTLVEITFGSKGDDEWRRRIIVRDFSDEKSDRDFRKASESAALMKQIRELGFSDGHYRVPAIIDILYSPRKIIIEEGQRGKSLYDVISTSSAEDVAKKTLELAAGWLARFHSANITDLYLKEKPPEKPPLVNTLAREEKRLDNYLKSFTTTNNPLSEDAAILVKFVRETQNRLLIPRRENTIIHQTPPTLCHGDFHPKNIIIGQDISHDISTQFISVIDFASVILHHPSFDIGYFIAQFENQFFLKEKILASMNEENFIKTYLDQLAIAKSRNGGAPFILSDGQKAQFTALVNFFKIRAYLSISSYLIKVGKGESPEVKQAVEKSKAIMAQYGKELYEI